MSETKAKKEYHVLWEENSSDTVWHGKIKALTIKSPWAQSIIRSGKEIENRSWSTSYRGPLLIHVSLIPNYLESGMIIGIVDLVDCLPPGNLFTVHNRWAEPGYYHWILKNPREFKEKIPAKGALSLWNYNLDPALLEMLL
ncbi:MAG: ASCH domain-containing protein [Treponema sp.]|jgi:hypothetical protein|nr:ASCH domain-containing protein [Treponema sp.]